MAILLCAWATAPVAATISQHVRAARRPCTCRPSRIQSQRNCATCPQGCGCKRTSAGYVAAAETTVPPRTTAARLLKVFPAQIWDPPSPCLPCACADLTSNHCLCVGTWHGEFGRAGGRAVLRPAGRPGVIEPGRRTGAPSRLRSSAGAGRGALHDYSPSGRTTALRRGRRGN